jgi:glycerol-3-phosphate acyltransferase PlsY
MTVLMAAIVGWVVGSLPTAGIIARSRGVDLMTAGSGNPGANNAWRLGGPRLGAAVLVIEAAKGTMAVAAGSAIGGPWAAAIAGVVAVVGNVANPWLGLRGGQGLGISAGVLATVWPIGFIIVLGIVAAVTAATRSTPAGALSGAAGLVVGTTISIPEPWGLTGGPLTLAVVGVAFVITPKQVIKLIRRRGNAPSRSRHR